MASKQPHPEALEDFDRAYVPERKIRAYALRNPGKRRPFEALGFSEGDDNWEALRDAILEELPYHPAVLGKRDQYGVTYEVVMPVTGPTGKKTPVRTYWIREWGQNSPRLITLYINTREWLRHEQEEENATDKEA